MFNFLNLFLTLKEGHRLRVVENMVMRKKFGLKWDEVTGDWRKLQSEDLHHLYTSSNIILAIK